MSGSQGRRDITEFGAALSEASAIKAYLLGVYGPPSLEIGLDDSDEVHRLE